MRLALFCVLPSDVLWQEPAPSQSDEQVSPGRYQNTWLALGNLLDLNHNPPLHSQFAGFLSISNQIIKWKIGNLGCTFSPLWRSLIAFVFSPGFFSSSSFSALNSVKYCVLTSSIMLEVGLLKQILYHFKFWWFITDCTCCWSNHSSHWNQLFVLVALLKTFKLKTFCKIILGQCSGKGQTGGGWLKVRVFFYWIEDRILGMVLQCWKGHCFCLDERRAMLSVWDERRIMITLTTSPTTTGRLHTCCLRLLLLLRWCWWCCCGWSRGWCCHEGAGTKVLCLTRWNIGSHQTEKEIFLRNTQFDNLKLALVSSDSRTMWMIQICLIRNHEF